jgi:hypothetical protein
VDKIFPIFLSKFKQIKPTFTESASKVLTKKYYCAIIPNQAEVLNINNLNFPD